MQPVRSLKNQYRGINAHLHSQWQIRGGWNGFHSVHIAFLATAIQRQLLDKGYEVDVQQSLQIRRFPDHTETFVSDVSIFAPPDQPVIAPFKRQSGAYASERVLPVPALLAEAPEVIYQRALAIYEFDPDRRARGAPVAWIELLSPSNKPAGSDYKQYRHKREALLVSGLVFVELDYLNHSPSTFAVLNSLPSNGEPAPYRIVMIDPRPLLTESDGHIWQFAVDDPLPTVHIPLNAGDALDFDFNAPYQRTFDEMFYGRLIDYAELPTAFDRYSTLDQARIVARMIAVLEAQARGDDLETSPLTPLETPQLDAALARLNALREA